MIKSISDRPTHVFELVARPPSYTGMVDASSTGVGGIWILPGWPPIVYRHQWPDNIHSRYRRGKLTNSDLELSGVLVAWFLLESCVPLRHTTSVVFSDNSPTVAWSHSLMSRSEQPTSSRLLRALAIRARTAESQVPVVPHWAGKLNRPADAASRSFDPNDSHYAVDDSHFLNIFTRSFPLPQPGSWQLRVIPPPLSQLISTLGGLRLPLRQWMYPPASATGACGNPTVAYRATPTHTSPHATQLTTAPCWWDSLPDIVRVSLAEATR
jgi:hypothetical protein